MESDRGTQEDVGPEDFKPVIVETSGALDMFSEESPGNSQRANIYQCGYCEKTFAKQDTCRTHERVHTGKSLQVSTL